MAKRNTAVIITAIAAAAMVAMAATVTVVMATHRASPRRQTAARASSNLEIIIIGSLSRSPDFFKGEVKP